MVADVGITLVDCTPKDVGKLIRIKTRMDKYSQDLRLAVTIAPFLLKEVGRHHSVEYTLFFCRLGGQSLFVSEGDVGDGVRVRGHCRKAEAQA